MKDHRATDIDSDPDRVWTSESLQTPHDQADKAARVAKMFSAIARSYDLNNRVHSLWRDQSWRRAAAAAAAVQPGQIVLDVACGTGDLAMAFAAGNAEAVIGIDFVFDMLKIAQEKRAGLEHPPRYHGGDAMRLPIAATSVDVVSIAFGIRNVADPALAAREFFRVMRPGGRVIILEFSEPSNPILRRLYQFYFRHIMSRTASLIARDRSGAYRYLPRSVDTFLDRPKMIAMLEATGFVEVTAKPLTVGIAVIYRGVKPAGS
jgi:demethylmenaquinone methyltransferase/2-methoxy-6-polyprenyl-1,4-benzoquinol methylase